MFAGAARATAAKDFVSAGVILAQGAAATAVIDAAIGNVSALAQGGIVASEQLVRVGEGNKKEAIIPLERPESRDMLQQAMGGGASGKPINVTLEIDKWKLAEIMVNTTAAGQARGRF